MAEAATFVTPPLARRALVPAARALLVVNELLFAIAAWLLLPVDIATPTSAHLLDTGEVFLFVSGFLDRVLRWMEGGLPGVRPAGGRLAPLGMGLARGLRRIRRVLRLLDRPAGLTRQEGSDPVWRVRAPNGV